MSPADNKPIPQVVPLRRGLPEELPPCPSCQASSPKTHELRTRYEARHAAEAALKSAKAESKT